MLMSNELRNRMEVWEGCVLKQAVLLLVIQEKSCKCKHCGEKSAAAFTELKEVDRKTTSRLKSEAIKSFAQIVCLGMLTGKVWDFNH